MVKYNININPKILQRLKDLAEEEGRTVSELIRQAIIELLKEKRKGK